VAATAEPVSTPVIRLADHSPAVLAAIAFAILFSKPAVLLVRDWWNDPDAGHGLLLAPLAIWLAWRSGLVPARPARVSGALILTGAVLLRYLSGLAAELFTMRVSLLMGAAGLVLFWYGWRQLLHWWLPVILLVLSIPLPDIVTSSLALPLQLRASRWGAALLEFRHVPANLSGNVIQLPGRQLFVTEACSGLRSLTALLSLGVLVGGLWLRHPAGRILLVLSGLLLADHLTPQAVEGIARLLIAHRIDGVIATNTTIERGGVKGLPRADEAGGLSGRPLKARATAVVAQLAKVLDGALPIIGVGGILSGADAKEKIEAGATLIQIYTGLIYRGPDLVAECARALAAVERRPSHA